MPVTLQPVETTVFGMRVKLPIPVLGLCPICRELGRPGWVYITEHAYQCTGGCDHDCNFTVHREYRGQTVGEEVIEQLIDRGYSDPIPVVGTDGRQHHSAWLGLEGSRVSWYYGPQRGVA